MVGTFLNKRKRLLRVSCSKSGSSSKVKSDDEIGCIFFVLLCAPINNAVLSKNWPSWWWWRSEEKGGNWGRKRKVYLSAMASALLVVVVSNLYDGTCMVDMDGGDEISHNLILNPMMIMMITLQKLCVQKAEWKGNTGACAMQWKCVPFCLIIFIVIISHDFMNSLHHHFQKYQQKKMDPNCTHTQTEWWCISKNLWLIHFVF